MNQQQRKTLEVTAQQLIAALGRLHNHHDNTQYMGSDPQMVFEECERQCHGQLPEALQALRAHYCGGEAV